MTGHTPGPWIVDHAEGQMPVGVATAAQFPICEMYSGLVGWTAPEPVAVKLANARLIASAPEMLAALIDCREALNRAGATGELAVINAAIDRATGESA